MKFTKGNKVLHLELSKAGNSTACGLTGWRDSSADKNLVTLWKLDAAHILVGKKLKHILGCIIKDTANQPREMFIPIFPEPVRLCLEYDVWFEALL